MARQAGLASPDPPGVPGVSPGDTGHQGTRRRASCWPLVRFRAAHRSKPSCIAPLLGVSRLAVQTPGRVPAGCGYYFGTSPVPAASSESAGHEPSPPVFNPSFDPGGLHLSPPQPFYTTILHRHSVLDCLQLGPRWYPVAQYLGERPYMLRQACCHRRCARSPPPWLSHGHW
jgi:hypothetical protein